MALIPNKSEFKALEFAHKLVVITAASLFLPYFFCVPFVLFAVGYSIFKRDIRQSMLAQGGARFIMLLPALSLLSAVYAGNVYGVFGAFCVAAVVWLGLFLRLVMNGRLYRMILDIFCVLSVVSFVVGAAQMIIIRSGNTQLYKSLYFVYNHEYFTGLLKAYDVYRSVSTFFNANYFAAIAAIAALICVYRFFQSGRVRVEYAVIFAVNIGSMLLAGSRTMFIALFAGLLVLLFLMKKYRILAAAAVVILAIAVVTVIFPESSLRFDSLASTVTKRLNIWSGAAMLLKNPMTVFFGEGMWAYCFHSVHDSGMVFAYHSHNMYLEFLLCFGIVGLALIAAYLIKCGVIIKKSPRRGGQAAIAASCICFLMVSGVTDVIITGMETSVITMFLLSVAGVYEKRERDGCDYV